MTDAARADASRSDDSNLTRAQSLMWMGQRLHPTTPLYNMVMTFTIHGVIDLARFRHAYEMLVECTDAMRTVVVEHNGVPRQHVKPHVPSQLEVVDFSADPAPDDQLAAWVERRAVHQFDLAEGLSDSALVKLRADKWVWYLNQHHLITDGWSTAILYRRMAALYENAMDQQRSAATPLYPTFQSYVEYERAYRQSKSAANTRAHWEEKSIAPRRALNFYGVEPPSGGTTRTERLRVDLGSARSERVRALATEQDARSMIPGVSLFNIFSTTLFACLARISGESDIAILAPAHNRSSKAFKDTAGLFIEVLPLHARVAKDETLSSLLAKTAQESHTFLIYARPAMSSAAQNRAYSVLLNVINASFEPFAGFRMQSEWIHPGHGDSSHSLRLQVHDFDDTGSIQLHFDVSRQVFDRQRQQDLIRHYLQMLDALLDDPTRRVRDVDLLSDDETSEHLVRFNQTEVGYPAATVVELLSEQVTRTPEAVALVCGKQEVTYRELGDASDRLAERLRGLGVGANARVGICLPRSTELVTALWGVLKVGACYVPIDPRFPADRIAFMVRDSSVDVLLTDETRMTKIPTTVAQTLLLPDAMDAGGHTTGGDGGEALTPRPDDLAYVIYTSGSTGAPKGVMISHGALANYVAWAGSQYAAGTVSAFPLYSSIAFDLTVTSIFVPLVAGGKVIVYPETDGRDLSVLQVFDEDRVDVVKLTPSHLALVQNAGFRPSRIKTLILGGEDLKTSLARAICDQWGQHLTIYNEYGPTEATVGCMLHRFDRTVDDGRSVPLGRPVGNMRVYLLDEALRPVPTGVIGEICVAGAGVARGYLGRPDLTDEYFREDPLHPGERLYRTGDLARWTGPGRMAFVGRADNQLKIRGARVEPSEVEAAMLTHTAIRECVIDVLQTETDHTARAKVRFCVRCGLASNHPDADLDESGVCNVCRVYATYRDKANSYFGSMEDLERIVERARRESSGDHDCVMFLSGGKDSTYALYRLVDMGLKVLVFSLDNGFISDGAKANIRRVVDDLGLELEFGTTPAMNAIFADSLKRFSNVCQGCFKTIYTLGFNLALSRGIKTVFTGLSRGQIFETRLADFFRNGVYDPAEIDRSIAAARLAYHRMDDVISRSLDVKIFDNDALFDTLNVVDFYRYCDVPLDEVLAFLDRRASWIRPSDTGRSTNCLINDTGIFVHKTERGFHNYALPYSWDVRLGHKERDAALAELDDEIDVTGVRNILKEVGYELRGPGVATTAEALEKRLALYYVSDDERVTPGMLREYLAQRLPDYMMPSYVVPLDALPLTPNGKVDRGALPDPRTHGRRVERDDGAPRTDTERVLAGIWETVLGIKGVGIRDDFIVLGGDSIRSIQLVTRAAQAGFRFTPQQVFEHPTIEELAAVPQERARAAEQTSITGPTKLTPIQRWFFELKLDAPERFSQAILLRVPAGLDVKRFESAVNRLIDHHDILRARFEHTAHGWEQRIEVDAPRVAVHAATDTDGTVADQVDRLALALNGTLDLARGELVKAALIEGADGADRVLILIHHLVVDGVSWTVLLEDLEAAYADSEGRARALPAKSTSYREWSEQLYRVAQSDRIRSQMDYWRAQCRSGSRHSGDQLGVAGPVQTVSVGLTADRTAALAREVPAVYNTSVQEVLVTSLLEAFSRWSGVHSISVNLEGHGREDIGTTADVTRTVGWFTSLYPVTLDRPHEGDLPTVLKSVKEYLRAIPDRGIGYGILRYLGDDASSTSRRQLAASDMVFNYLGRLDSIGAGSSAFQLDGPLKIIRDPDTPTPHALEIAAYVYAGVLTVDWTFRPGHPLALTFGDSTAEDIAITAESVEELATHFRTSLTDLMDEVLADTKGGFTPSDFPEADLSQSELDDILRTFGESGS